MVGSVPLAAFGPKSYAISVGTLSEVIPFPPGQVLIISTSSGVDVYTAATLCTSQSMAFVEQNIQSPYSGISVGLVKITL